MQGLLIHHREGPLFGHEIPEDRLPEVDTRHAGKMLARAAGLDGRPLTEERPPEKRLVGCCRDFTVLFCTLARHQGIPARARVGFSAYFDPAFHHDHEVAEVWDAGEGRWRLVDAQMSDLHVERNGLRFDVRDVPRDEFIVGGLAWRMCRDGVADPEGFGVDPDGEIKGWWFVRHKLVQDLAAQNKDELLLWDVWGRMEGEPSSEEDLALLDGVAELTQGGDEAFGEMRSVYEETPGLKAPPVVNSYSPALGPREVRLTA